MKITHTKIESAQETISCSALDKIAGFVKKISQSLWSSLMSLGSEGINVDRSEEGKNGIFYLRATTKKGNKFTVKCSPVAGKPTYDLFFLTEVGVAPEMRQDVAEGDIAKVIGKWAHNLFERDAGKITELTDEEGQDRMQSNTTSGSTNESTAGSTNTADAQTEGE